MNDQPLPAKYFPEKLETQLYETAFELLDILGHLLTDKDASSIKRAEFCYTGNYMDVDPSDFPMLELTFKFNPVNVDDEKLLNGDLYRETIAFDAFTREILFFAITTYDIIISHDESLGDELAGLERTICEYQDILESDFNIILVPPEELE
ncbi:hypothetical protein GF325_17050 [Candidatus Bathyarchaeota archaeon]|nr:hypothetical protein [Candidatus Bathyarchaeota archaeon]